MRSFLVVFLAALLLACAHSAEKRVAAAPSQLPTCAVLSVGGLQGVAHVGALMALRDAGVRIDCISGTSIGSLVAGLYATAPSENLVDRFRSFKGAYRSRTEDDVGVGGMLGALAVGVLTGGAALPAMAGGLLPAGARKGPGR
jgi:predicted acylesterase/phospholipase RssA